MMSANNRHKWKNNLFLGFSCGCKSTKSVSVSSSRAAFISANKSHYKRLDSGVHKIQQTKVCEDFEVEQVEEMETNVVESSVSTPIYSGLLRQLSELEKSADSETCNPPTPIDFIGDSSSSSSDEFGVGVRAEKSVAVVKESVNPLEDFRRSMLQMIVEKEIICGEEMQELLYCFLALNSPCHHDIIVQAFSWICDEVFSRYEDTRHFIHRSHSQLPFNPWHL